MVVDRQTGGQADIETDRQTNKQTERKITPFSLAVVKSAYKPSGSSGRRLSRFQ